MLKKSFSALLCGLVLLQGVNIPVIAQEEAMTEEASTSSTKVDIDLSQVLTSTPSSIEINLDGASLLKGAVSILNSYPSYMQTPIREWLIQTQDSEKNITDGASMAFTVTLPEGVRFDDSKEAKFDSTLNDLCEVIPLSITDNQASFGLKIVSNTKYGQLVDAIESSTIGEYNLSLPLSTTEEIDTNDILLEGKMDSLYHLSKMGDILIPVSFNGQMTSTFAVEEMEIAQGITSKTVKEDLLIRPTLTIDGKNEVTLTQGSTFALTGTLSIASVKKRFENAWIEYYQKYFAQDQANKDPVNQDPVSQDLENDSNRLETASEDFEELSKAIKVTSPSMKLQAQLSLPNEVKLPADRASTLLKYISIPSPKDYFKVSVESLKDNNLILNIELDTQSLGWKNFNDVVKTLDELDNQLEIKISGLQAQSVTPLSTLSGTIDGKFTGKASWVQKQALESGLAENSISYDIAYDFKDWNTYTSTLPEEQSKTRINLKIVKPSQPTSIGNSTVEIAQSEIEGVQDILSSIESGKIEDKTVLNNLEKAITKNNQYNYKFGVLEAVVSKSNDKTTIQLKLSVSLKEDSLINLVFNNLKKKPILQNALIETETEAISSISIEDLGNQVTIKKISVKEAFKDGKIDSDKIKEILKDYDTTNFNFNSAPSQNSSFKIDSLDQPITIAFAESTPVYSSGGSKKPNKKPVDSEPEQPTSTTSGKKTVLYRLYNNLTGEHFFTSNKEERDSLLQDEAWDDEGQGWKTPEFSNLPIYRLCNPNNGDHHYTTDKNEYDVLQTHGWVGEGVAMYSAEAEDENIVLLHRLYNPNAQGAGSHHYTVDENERNELVSRGWNYEGTAWYGLTDSE